MRGLAKIIVLLVLLIAVISCSNRSPQNTAPACFDLNEYAKKCTYTETKKFAIEEWMYPGDADGVPHKKNKAIVMDSVDYCRIYMDTNGRPGDDDVVYFYSFFKQKNHYLAFITLYTTTHHDIMLNLVTVDSCGILIDELQLAYDSEGTAMGGDSHSYGEFINDTTYRSIKTQYGYPPDYLDKIDTITSTIKINDWGKIESDIDKD